MAIPKVLRSLASTTVWDTLKLLYPPHCPLCEAPLMNRLRYVCDQCLAQIRRVEPPWCARCGGPLDAKRDLCELCAHEEIPFECARSFGLYEGPLAQLLQLLKFHSERALARELAPFLAQTLAQEDLTARFEGITYVPMSARSQWARGFNQSELLARRVGALVNKPVFTTLWKYRETRPQVDLSGKERLENVKDAFVPLAPARCPSILLIDDVYTTGATLRECSRTLRTAGYEHVYVLTAARTPLALEEAHEG